MSVKERLKQVISAKQISQAAFCRQIGVSAGYIGAMRKSMQPEVIDSIAIKFPEINIAWLMTGNGDMFKDHIGIISITRDQILKTPLETPIYNSDITCRQVPCEFPDEQIIGYINLPDISKNAHIVLASGDSMQPIILNGDRIALREIERWDYLYYGQIYLIITSEYRMLKYIHKHPTNKNLLILRSENSKYDDIELRKKDIVRLFVVENILSIKNMM